MKKILFQAGLLSGALMLLPGCVPITAKAEEVHSGVPRELTPQVADADLAELVQGNTDFAFALYKQFSTGDVNVIYSPYSVSIALAMLSGGANGPTADQMAQALRYTLPGEKLHPAFNRLALELASRADIKGIEPDQAFQLNVANSLWGQSGFHFESVYLDLLARNYAAGLRLVDYRADPESARRSINDWVSQSTNQKIKDIIPQGAIDTLTRLVLANAVYFHASWLYPFLKNATQPGTFILLDGTAIQTPLMHLEKGLAGMTGDGYQAVELPYVSPALSMLILVPDAGRFGEVEAKLDSDLLAETVAALQWNQLRLTMPKFKFEWSQGLVDGLRALGMTNAFVPETADFSGMDGARDLYVSAILHKAFVAVDEEGTEAAAATVIMVGASALPDAPTEFIIDRPFFFLIRDNPTGTILFLGKVTNPAM
jgi:serpin B